MEDASSDLFNKPVGNKEATKLAAKPVVIQGKVIEVLKYKTDHPDSKKAGKEWGKKLVLLCKHPDKEEIVKIHTIKFIVGESIKEDDLLVRLDVDGNIEKGSKVALLLANYKLATINDLDGKSVDTELGKLGYLVIKCY